jgi:hypothetical protein
MSRRTLIDLKCLFGSWSQHGEDCHTIPDMIMDRVPSSLRTVKKQSPQSDLRQTVSHIAYPGSTLARSMNCAAAVQCCNDHGVAGIKLSDVSVDVVDKRGNAYIVADRAVGQPHPSATRDHTIHKS